MNCKRCNSELNGLYCANCGHPKQPKKITSQYILTEIASILNFDKGILFTIKELLLRPGSSIRQFIHEDRNRLVKPIFFMVICSLIYTILQHTFQFEDGYVNYSFGKDTSISTLSDMIATNYGYANILIAVFIALWVKIFFIKHPYNFFEILVLLCYVIGMGMLIFTLFGIIDTLVDFQIIDKGFFIGILYISWGIGQFFKKEK